MTKHPALSTLAWGLLWLLWTTPGLAGAMTPVPFAPQSRSQGLHLSARQSKPRAVRLLSTADEPHSGIEDWRLTATLVSAGAGALGGLMLCAFTSKLRECAAAFFYGAAAGLSAGALLFLPDWDGNPCDEHAGECVDGPDRAHRVSPRLGVLGDRLVLGLGYHF